MTLAIAETTRNGSLRGNLCGIGQRGVGASLVDVVVADVVGEEDAVEAALLEQLGVVGPVAQVLVARALIVLVAPEPRRQVRRALEVEGEQPHASRRHRFLRSECEHVVHVLNTTLR